MFLGDVFEGKKSIFIEDEGETRAHKHKIISYISFELGSVNVEYNFIFFVLMIVTQPTYTFRVSEHTHTYT